MKVGLKQIRFVVIQRQASSLFEVIADGRYRATYLGRDKWKTLIGSQGSLQWNCNKEGFNVASIAISLTPKQESVSLVTANTTAVHVTPESGSGREGVMTTRTHVETRLETGQITATSISSRWGIF